MKSDSDCSDKTTERYRNSFEPCYALTETLFLKMLYLHQKKLSALAYL